MRSIFPEFYGPTLEEVKNVVLNGTVVVDTNVLLALYRMSATQRDEVLRVLESIRERLWIPYQVGLEFQRNRLTVIAKQASFYRQLTDLHGVKSVAEIAKKLDAMEMPKEVQEEVKLHLAPLRESLLAAADHFIKAAREIAEKHVVTTTDNHDDPVRERLDALFLGRIGTPPAPETYTSRKKEAARRINEKIPPGYMDGEKEGEDRKAGDYLLWAELLEYAQADAAAGRPTLLVTNDRKEDWYLSSDKKLVGPRPELVREFHRYNPHGYHQVTLDGLLRLAKEHLSAEVDDATIEKASALSSELGGPNGYVFYDNPNSIARLAPQAGDTPSHVLLNRWLLGARSRGAMNGRRRPDGSIDFGRDDGSQEPLFDADEETLEYLRTLRFAPDQPMDRRRYNALLAIAVANRARLNPEIAWELERLRRGEDGQLTFEDLLGADYDEFAQDALRDANREAEEAAAEAAAEGS